MKQTLSKLSHSLSVIAVSTLLSTTSAAELEEVVVTAELIQQSVLELPNSVTVIDRETVERRGAQNLEDLLNLAPNVNFSTGASRGRFIQIRGIGERSEFQEPIINSVGIIVDGIDFTGIATGASTLDLKQVEVLRGPQGTLFGANALAGLINVVSNEPSNEFYGRITAAIEDYDGRETSAVISGPATDHSAFRLAIKKYQSNGFTDNVFLNRDDTNNIDETTARARFITQVNDALSMDFTVFLADIDNGYDAFSLDNTRKTYSDQPGFDRQKTSAASLKTNYLISDSVTFEGLISVAKSDLDYAYDEDWSNIEICQGTACDSNLFGFDWFYSSFDSYARQNDNTTLDLKLVSANNNGLNWVAGVYHRDQNIDLDRVYTFADSDFNSDYNTANTAIYGQIDVPLNDHWSLTSGLRLEQRDVDYNDNLGAIIKSDENLWGGRVAIEYQADSGAFYYGLISRGYKPGGFNLEGSLSALERQFDTETMINYELGFKQRYYDDRLQLQVSVFYQDRDDIQTKQSIVRSIATDELNGICPCSFTDFTGNASGGTNAGIEIETNWQANDRLSFNFSLGLLDTEFDTLLTFDHVNADRANGIAFDLKGREQAHAPAYQSVIGGAFALTSSLTLSGSIEVKDEFFFSDRHEERSDAYELVNLELTYALDNWSMALYAKNLSDEVVKTRGFGSFGNDPRKFYETEPYNQFGAPRVIGIRGSLEF